MMHTATCLAFACAFATATAANDATSVSSDSGNLVINVSAGGGIIVNKAGSGSEGTVELKDTAALIDAVKLGYNVGLKSLPVLYFPEPLNPATESTTYGIFEGVINVNQDGITVLASGLADHDDYYNCECAGAAPTSGAVTEKGAKNVMFCEWPSFKKEGVAVPAKVNCNFTVTAGAERRALPYLPQVLDNSAEDLVLQYAARGPVISGLESAVELDGAAKEKDGKMPFSFADPDSDPEDVTCEVKSSDTSKMTVKLGEADDFDQEIEYELKEGGDVKVTVTCSDKHDGAKLNTAVHEIAVTITTTLETCVDYKLAGRKSGVYKINFGGVDRMVYCDMDTEGGGWMLAMVISDKSRKHVVPNAYYTQYVSESNPQKIEFAGGRGIIGNKPSGDQIRNPQSPSEEAKAVNGDPNKMWGCFEKPKSRRDNIRPCKHSDAFIEAYARGDARSASGDYTNAFKFKCHLDHSTYGVWQYFDKACKFSSKDNDTGKRDTCRKHRTSWNSKSTRGHHTNRDDCGLGRHAWAGDGGRASTAWHSACYNSLSEIRNEREDMRCCRSFYHLGCGINERGGNGNGEVWIR
jgi:hypothetical protein